MQYNYDLFIVDIVIPGISGLELCRKLKNIKPNVSVLILTALGTTEDKLLGFDAGADDYLVKPFEFRELLARVKVLLKRTGMISETTNKIEWLILNLTLTGKLPYAMASGLN